MKKFNILFIVLSVFFVCSCNHNAANPEKEKTSEPAAGETLYSLTVNAAANGKITPNKTSEIRAGEEIVLIVEPNEGYKLKTLTAVTEEPKDIAVAAVSKGTVYKFTMPIGNVTVNSEFSIKTITEDLSDPQADGAVLYKIEHWLQTAEDLETYELAVVQTKSGEAGEDTTAAAKTYSGFNTVPFNQKAISENGNTVVKIFYNRKIITYTFDPKGGNWDGDTNSKIVTGPYGTVVNKPQNPVRGNYPFNYWDVPIPEVFGPNDDYFFAEWDVKPTSFYTVNIYKQNLEGGDNYTLFSTEVLAGSTDYQTEYSAPDIYGFERLAYSDVIIEPDDSSVLNVYYNRKTFTVTFNTNGGSSIPSQKVLYEAKIQMPDDPVKDNCTFYKWYADFSLETIFNPDTIISSNTVIYASWKEQIEPIIYNFHDTIEKLPKGTTDGTAGTTAEYVLFGDFPQSRKPDWCVVNENTTKQMGNMIVYSGEDGYWYAKVENKYYKVEPVKWLVVSKDENGKALLLAEDILTAMCWDDDDEQIIYTQSDIFNYLNNVFLNNTFTASAQQCIEETSITPDGYDYYDEEAYTCWTEYTANSKIFLLNRNEVADVYSLTGNMYKYSTDYCNTKTNNCYEWWVRSSFYDGPWGIQGVYAISYDAYPSMRINQVFDISGVVPAITVYLPD